MILQEHEIVPYTCSPLPEAPWLVLAPHPDDESFGMGGTLARAAAEGIRCEVLVLTDGALGGEGGKAGGAGSLAALRESESRIAGEALGVADIQFWRLPDRGLLPRQDLVDRLAELIESRGARTVFFPNIFELHPDHRIAAELAWRALARVKGRPPRPAAYEISVQSPVNTLVDISRWVGAKRKAMDAYASQLTENAYVDIILALNKARTYTLPAEIGYAEGFFLFEEKEAQKRSLKQAMVPQLEKLFADGRQKGRIFAGLVKK